MKPIPPTTPSRYTDRKTSRTKLTGLKPAEDLFFFFFSFFLSSYPPEFLLPFCPSFFFYSFFLPSFTFFIPSSCLLLFILLFSVVLIFVKIPSYLASDLSLFLLPSFLSFSIPFFPPSLLFFSSFPPSFLFFPQVRQ